jgi:hypothetical protein
MILRDIAVGREKPTWSSTDSARGRGTCNSLCYIPREQETTEILSYVSAMSHIIDTEPSCHGEATSQQVWQDAMTEEYQSIMKNDVWDIVSRPKGSLW